MVGSSPTTSIPDHAVAHLPVRAGSIRATVNLIPRIKESISMSDFALDFITRRKAVFGSFATLLTALVPGVSNSAQVTGDELTKRFEFLSKNGNSNCSQAFLESIRTMSDTARLQGSCCGPMDLHRYGEQIAGLKVFSAIPEIPPDPYDIEARLAKRLLAAYDIKLKVRQQKAYDRAMATATEKGPCCCECWRWHVYGGLGKLLIRDRGFDGGELAKVWNLSDGCGGENHAH